MLDCCWDSVGDAGPAVIQHWVNESLQKLLRDKGTIERASIQVVIMVQQIDIEHIIF